MINVGIPSVTIDIERRSRSNCAKSKNISAVFLVQVLLLDYEVQKALTIIGGDMRICHTYIVSCCLCTHKNNNVSELSLLWA